MMNDSGDTQGMGMGPHDYPAQRSPGDADVISADTRGRTGAIRGIRHGMVGSMDQMPVLGAGSGSSSSNNGASNSNANTNSGYGSGSNKSSSGTGISSTILFQKPSQMNIFSNNTDGNTDGNDTEMTDLTSNDPLNTSNISESDLQRIANATVGAFEDRLAPRFEQVAKREDSLQSREVSQLAKEQWTGVKDRELKRKELELHEQRKAQDKRDQDLDAREESLRNFEGKTELEKLRSISPPKMAKEIYATNQQREAKSLVAQMGLDLDDELVRNRRERDTNRRRSEANNNNDAGEQNEGISIPGGRGKSGRTKGDGKKGARGFYGDSGKGSAPTGTSGGSSSSSSSSNGNAAASSSNPGQQAPPKPWR